MSFASQFQSNEFYAEDERQLRKQLIDQDAFYVGAAISTACGGQLLKVVLSNGTTIAMREKHGTTEGDSREHDLITKLPFHPNIIDHYAVKYMPSTGATRIFMEHFSTVTLRDMIAEVGTPLSDVTGRAFARQILNALAFLHRHNVAHRNLNNSNVLVDSHGTAKIGDLATAKEVEKGSSQSLTIMSAPQNTPPEVLSCKVLPDEFEQATKGDIWCFGIMMVEAQNNNVGPWPAECVGASSILRFLNSDEPVVIPPHISPLAADFMLRCLDRNPATRWSAEQLLGHEWIADTTNTSTFHSIDILIYNKENQESKFVLHKVIGTGAFGTVYAAKMKDTDQDVAVKAISYDTRNKGECSKVRKAMKEISIMKELTHPNIVQYLFLEKADVSLDGHQTVYIGMEYITGGTLKQRITDRGKLSEAEAAHFTRQMLLGLQYLHSNGFVHRDIKPSNCLLTSADDSCCDLKLADFGTATRVNGNETVTANMQGTLLYMAPEIIREETPTTSADIWSLGASLMEMITGNNPWSHIMAAGTSFALIGYITSTESLTMPPASDVITDFLSRCLVRDPSQRASCEDLLKHPWIATTSCDIAKLSYSIQADTNDISHD